MIAISLSGDGDDGDGVQVWDPLRAQFCWFEEQVLAGGRWMNRYVIDSHCHGFFLTFLLTSSSPYYSLGKDLTIHSQVHIHAHVHALLQIQAQEGAKHSFAVAATVAQEEQQEGAQGSQYSGPNHTVDSPARGVHTAAHTDIGSQANDNCSGSCCATD